MPHVFLFLFSVVGALPKGRAAQGAQASSACVHIALGDLCGALALWLSLQASFGHPGAAAPSRTLLLWDTENCNGTTTFLRNMLLRPAGGPRYVFNGKPVLLWRRPPPGVVTCRRSQ